MLSFVMIVFDRPLEKGSIEVIISDIPFSDVEMVTKTLREMFPGSLIFLASDVSNG